MLRIAVPNKGTLSEPAADMLAEAGYRGRHETRDLSVVDPANDVEFFFLRPRDIAVYVGSGELDLGLTGRDLALDAGAPVREVLALGFGRSVFRYAAPADLGWDVADLHGRRVATAYPRLVGEDLARRGIEAELVALDGAVEISVQLGVADAVADVVGSGRTLRNHGLAAFGEPICESEAVVVGRASSPLDGRATQLVRRLEGVALARRYVMLDYDCPQALVDDAVALTPGLESPTISPLREEGWVAIRAMVPRADMNDVMDALAAVGCAGILASDLRSCRL
ncbi:MAG: ATP phosphoribosyltransferase [Actinobacteria bacterium]|nr:ATP phosphoribosyltransferase [Actinomycetota bacterium]